jgi:hypothetical protein
MRPTKLPKQLNMAVAMYMRMRAWRRMLKYNLSKSQLETELEGTCHRERERGRHVSGFNGERNERQERDAGRRRPTAEHRPGFEILEENEKK